jgi:hypothetical protein
VALEAQVFKKLKLWLDPDYWLFKDTEIYRWPWPRSDKLDEIKFQIALNQVQESAEALQKTIDKYKEHENARNRL